MSIIRSNLTYFTFHFISPLSSYILTFLSFDFLSLCLIAFSTFSILILYILFSLYDFVIWLLTFCISLFVLLTCTFSTSSYLLLRFDFIAVPLPAILTWIIDFLMFAFKPFWLTIWHLTCWHLTYWFWPFAPFTIVKSFAKPINQFQFS